MWVSLISSRTLDQYNIYIIMLVYKVVMVKYMLTFFRADLEVTKTLYLVPRKFCSQPFSLVWSIEQARTVRAIILTLQRAILYT